MKRNFSGAGLRLLTALLLVGRSPELFAAEPTPLDTFDARARLVMDAALSDVAKLNGGSPMHFWIAQRLFEQGEKERALAIVKSGVKLAREFIEKRERGKHNSIGYNGFMYWAMLNCYVHWHRQFDQELLDDYPYGVMWDEPATNKGSHLWFTVPAEDGKRLGLHTHGVNSRHVQFAQHRGSLLLIATDLDSVRNKFPYVLGYIPGGWRAMINDSQATGHIFLDYGSALIALSATHAFEWDPQSGVLSGSRRPEDSEFRIRGKSMAVGLETAPPGQAVAAFREAVLTKSKIAMAGSTATFTDRDGVVIERTFNGDTRINGERVAYETWPLLDNPWMRQEFGGNLTLTDGKTTRYYDVTNWTITETTKP